MRSQAEEDYLKAIYEAQYERRDEWVTTTALAHELSISPASVTEMLKKLSAPDRALVRYERYHGVQLTEAGEKAALEVVRHHRLIESFLSSTLGLPWDKVHAEAHQLEHAISEELEERIARYLGNPARDPHGSPIPQRDGAMEPLADVRLTDLPPGRRAEVQRVMDDDPALLRYLSELGLILGAHVEVVERVPFEGPLYVRIEEPHTLRALGAEITDQVFVGIERISPDRH
jgi:DtxR family transcriptional regulator, Mn-dependent transcriptional regulator